MMKYCNGIRKQIVDLLFTELFSKANLTSVITLNEIDNWYQTFSTNFLKPRSSSIPLGIRVPSTNFAGNYLGHDLPIWMEGNFKTKVNSIWKESMPQRIDTVSPIGGKRVMIVGQDPMRKSPDPRDLIIKSPWGLHDPQRYGKHASFHNLVVCPLLAKGYTVYVTDFYKLYVTKNQCDPLDSRKNVMNLGVDFGKIFQKEIDIVDPQYIIIMSSDKNVYGPIVNSIHKSNLKVNTLCIRHTNDRRFLGKGSKSTYYNNELNKLP